MSRVAPVRSSRWNGHYTAPSLRAFGARRAARDPLAIKRAFPQRAERALEILRAASRERRRVIVDRGTRRTRRAWCHSALPRLPETEDERIAMAQQRNTVTGPQRVEMPFDPEPGALEPPGHPFVERPRRLDGHALAEPSEAATGQRQ